MSGNNPFKEIEEQEEKAPPQLKKQVMESVRLSQLIMGMADLFLLKFGKSLEGLFKIDKPNQDKL